MLAMAPSIAGGAVPFPATSSCSALKRLSVKGPATSSAAALGAALSLRWDALRGFLLGGLCRLLGGERRCLGKVAAGWRRGAVGYVREPGFLGGADHERT